MVGALCFAFLLLHGITAAAEARLNEIQVIGSHNSYHFAPPPAVLGLIGKVRKDALAAWDYSHPPIREQLQKDGLRQFELDVYGDPEGCLYAQPFILKMAALAGKKTPPSDPKRLMQKPGFTILHVPGIDGWPPLSETRGKCLFMLDNTGPVRDAYPAKNKNLARRFLFVSAPKENHPAAAIFKVNKTRRDAKIIRALVKKGFLVRTRADSKGFDEKRRDAAFASGAQWISSDHFSRKIPVPRRVAFPGGKTIRPNPVSKPQPAKNSEKAP